MNKAGNKISCFTAVFSLIITVAVAQPVNDTTKKTHSFSLQQAVDYARKNNVQVKNALLDIEMQKQVNREITSNAYPHINGNISTSYNPSVATQVLPNFISPATYQVLIDEGVKDGSGNPIQMPSDFGFIAAQFGTKFSATAGVSLSQILFDGQVFVGLQARDASIRFRKKNAELTEEAIKTNIYKIYYQLLAGKTQIELLDANIALLERLLRDTRILYENGFRENLDIDKVSVQLTNLQTEKNKVVSGISNGYYGLKVLMGMPVQDELILTDTLDEETIKADILANVSYNYADRKEFQLAEILKELNQYNIKRYKLSQVPTVALAANYAKNAQRDKWDFFGKGDWFTISTINLNIAIPIFNGYYAKSKIQQARIDLQKRENEIESLKLSIDNEVATAKNNFQSAIERMEFQRKNMDLAEKVYQQTKKKYEVGTGTQSDLNIAQTDLRSAQANYILALYDAIIARVDYLEATGKL